MTDPRIRRQLEHVAQRFRRLRLFTWLALLWAGLSLAGAAYVARSGDSDSPWPTAALIGAALGATALCVWLNRRSFADLRRIAAKIEARHPGLESRLLTAVDQEPAAPGGRLGFLQDRVVREALLHGFHEPWGLAVSGRRMRWARLGSLAALACLLLVFVALLLQDPGRVASDAPAANRVEVFSADVEYQFTIEPGDTEVERGTSLLVLARFPDQLPPEVMLSHHDASGSAGQLSMSRSLDDPVFAGRIARVQQDLSYRVAFGNQQTRPYQVRVFEYPELKRSDAALVYPEYTSLAEKTLTDVRRITAVEGTQATLRFTLNKPVAEGRLVAAADAAHVALAADPAEPTVYVARLTLDESRRYTLRLTDAEGRGNKFPPEFVINVTANRPPDLKLARPARDVQVSPLEELRLAASAWDDFGLSGLGLTYSLAGQPSQDVVFQESSAGRERHAAEHLVAFEALSAEPDQLLSYHFWAEDVGPDGQPRRTFSDMFFAEVRHFEEIFRQGQQPSGGAEQQQREQQAGQGGDNAQQADQLVEMQKQIISGTWKVIRRETGSQPTDDFDSDAALLRDSQQSALERVAELAGNLEDAESQAHVAGVTKHMQQALEHLTNAVDGPAINALQPALAAEQSAYQALLKLRAREHEVVRGNQQQGQGGQQAGSARGASSRFQQQLQQLELRNSENRYETQRAATPQEQETAAQRESREVLNRLQELARRQEDLNERIKELQTELQAAQTQEEREEIERQLKRLRDEQREILRDTDELRNQMDQPQNQERMADARQQLDETRENVRRASEALEQGQVTQAAASGERAEREFNELREDFRRQTSGQFEQDVRELRTAARELAENERRLAENLEELTNPGEKSLRDTGRRDEAGQAVGEQQRRVDDLLDRMETTIRDAEDSEPLLSGQLYDTLRDTRQGHLSDALEATQQLLERGFPEDARETERIAREEIDKLQQGIERAAESVLGDGTEALRRALGEVEELQRQLDQEIARADPSGQPAGDQEQNDRRGAEPANGGREAGDETPQRSESAADRADRADRPGNPTGQQDPGQQQEEQPGAGPGNRQPPQPGETQRPPEGRQQSSGQQGRGGEVPPMSDGERSGRRSPSDRESPDQRPADQAAGPRDAGGPNGLGGLERFFEGNERLYAPLTGDDFRQWSDRLRAVEEMVDDPDLRAEAARIRERARATRVDMQRHSQTPNWDLVRLSIAQPLGELQQRISEELLRRQSQDALVPIDRDPVPPRFAEPVRKYYERLGSAAQQQDLETQERPVDPRGPQF